MFKPTALQVGVELPADTVGQRFTLLGQLVDQGRVVCFDNLVEQCLFGLMGGVCLYSLPDYPPAMLYLSVPERKLAHE